MEVMSVPGGNSVVLMIGSGRSMGSETRIECSIMLLYTSMLCRYARHSESVRAFMLLDRSDSRSLQYM